MNSEMLNIINSVNPNWSKDLIVRYLYIKLAPFFQRDLLFFCASYEEKLQQYQRGFINRIPYVTCYTLADFYVNLFAEFDIESKKVIATSSQIPLFAILIKGELGWYFIDPLNDLMLNQYGLETQNFGIIPRYHTINNNHPEIIKLEDSYLLDLDKRLQLIPEDGYLDGEFKELAQKVLNKNAASEFFQIAKDNPTKIVQAKLKLLNDKYINLGHVNGSYERILLYFYLFKNVLNKTEAKYVRTFLAPQSEQRVDLFIELNTLKEGTILYQEEKHNGQFSLTRIH